MYEMLFALRGICFRIRTTASKRIGFQGEADATIQLQRWNWSKSWFNFRFTSRTLTLWERRKLRGTTCRRCFLRCVVLVAFFHLTPSCQNIEPTIITTKNPDDQECIFFFYHLFCTSFCKVSQPLWTINFNIDPGWSFSIRTWRINCPILSV